ncbi:MAG TPA: LacI family DNA-binding transcriptional regulator [Feifaniaceae bacterium]|nr:LacI family DNA-binding transcriptional regulator [Feifaniaceae bacterium]
MVKLTDIAKELGLSVSTISRVVNGRDRVDPHTRQMVQRALREHAYEPNEVARSLRLKDAKTIGIIIPDITNTYYSAVIKGVESVCREYGYSALVCNTDESTEREEDALKLLLKKQISGLVIASIGKNEELLQSYVSTGVPVVCFDNILPDFSGADCVSIDNIAAARRLTQELLARGYKKIGMIAGPLNQSTGIDRLRGYQQALEGAGIPAAESWIGEGDFKMQSGYEQMCRILMLPRRPEAVVVANNYMAYGAIRALRESEYRIPEDMAVAAFDCIDDTGLISPRISSVVQPAVEIGAQAARLIMERILEKIEGRYAFITLQPQMQPGESW